MKDELCEGLLQAWLDGRITADELAQLDAHLRASPEARARLARLANLDTALRAWAEPADAAAAWISLPREEEKIVRFPAPAWLAAAASIALLAVGAWHFLPPTRDAKLTATSALPAEETSLGCAILTRVVGAEFAGPAPRAGDSLGAGPFKLRSGLAQIEFFSGATLVLEGSAEIDIQSSWEVVCKTGTARVRVPTAAHGFRVRTPEMKLVDLGTEFGVRVESGGRTEVQVFDGEVEAHPTSAAMLSLKKGEGLRATGATLARLDAVQPDHFVGLARLDALSGEQSRARFAQWQDWSQRTRSDPRLIAYFPFTAGPSVNRLLENIVPASGVGAGGIVGASWTRGRWPGKDGLEFKRPGDRVRLNIPGTFDAITLSCSVRIDGLDRLYTGLLLTDGYEEGEPHWQIYQDGRIFFAISYSEKQGADAKPERFNQRYASPVVFTAATAGRWHHLAVTYDTRSGEVAHFVDGREISREVNAHHIPGRPVVFGPCEIGNWGLPVGVKNFVRNLNGVLDEFAIYRTALTPAEIAELAAQSRQE